MRNSRALLAAAGAALLLLLAADAAARVRPKAVLPKLDCGAACPLVLVMLTERDDGPLSPPWWEKKNGCRQPLGTAEAFLTADLATIGYRVIERQKLPGGGAGLCWIESATPGSKELAGYAASLGATILIYGDVVAAGECPRRMGTSLRHCRTSLSLRAIALGNGRVLATTTAEAPGSQINLEEAHSRATRAAVRKAAIDLGEKLQRPLSGDGPTGASAAAEPGERPTTARRQRGGANRTDDVTASGNGADRDAAIQAALSQSIRGTAESYLSEKTRKELAGWLGGELVENTKGLVQDYSIRREEKTDDGYRVELKARIINAKLRDTVNAKLRHLRGASLPTTLVMIQEHGSEASNEPWWANSRCAGSDLDVAENVFMEGLVRGGITVIDRRVLQNEAAASCPLAGSSPSDTELQKFGPGLGADVVIIGDAQAETTDSSMMGTQLKNARGSVSLRIVNLDDGSVLGTLTTSASGSHISKSESQRRALGAAADLAADQMLTILLDRWAGATSR